MNFERYTLDYRKVPISDNAIIYADIPYYGTNCGSYRDFNHDDFYAWALKQTAPIYISEYAMPDDFVKIHNIKKRQLSSAKGATELIEEGIWVPRHLAEELKQKCTYQISLFDL